MKMSVLIASTLCACIVGTAQAAAEIYTIEPAHTYPSFEVSHEGMSYWRGKFTQDQRQDLARSRETDGRVDITVDTGSADFGMAMLDQRVRGEEWFNVEKYPTAHYVSDSSRSATAYRPWSTAVHAAWRHATAQTRHY